MTIIETTEQLIEELALAREAHTHHQAEIDRLRAENAELKELLPWTDFADDSAAHELARLRKENAELREGLKDIATDMDDAIAEIQRCYERIDEQSAEIDRLRAESLVQCSEDYIKWRIALAMKLPWKAVTPDP